MKKVKLILLLLGVGLVFMTICLAEYAGVSWLYTTRQLEIASRRGVYASAEEGMLAMLGNGYSDPHRIEIIYAGTNSFDGSVPHVWYVIACVWAEKRSDGSPVGSWRHEYDQPGLFFIQTKQGWVQVKEGQFPEFIGYWMTVFDLAGPGSSTPSHDWGENHGSGCEF